MPPGGSSTVKPKVRKMEAPKPDKPEKSDGDRSSRMYVDPTTRIPFPIGTTTASS